MGVDEVCQRTADLMSLSDVHRWNVIKTLRSQSVAEHSFNVAVIARELMHRLRPSAGYMDLYNLLWWSLVHDAPETYTGDLDGKFKREHPRVSGAVADAEHVEFPWLESDRHSAGEHVIAIVKLADRIEAIQFIDTWGHGGRADGVFRELQRLMDESLPDVARVLQQPYEDVLEAAHLVMYQSVNERNGIQIRKQNVHERREVIGHVV